MRNHVLRAGVALLALALSGSPALGADDLNLSEQRFRPSPHTYDFLAIQTTAIEDWPKFNVGLMLNWSADTMILKDAAGQQEELLTGRLTADIVASLSLFRYFSLGVVFPLHVYNISGSPNAAFSNGTGGAIDRRGIESFAWGDLRISAKGRILDARESMFGVGLAVDVTVPTGKKDAFATDDGVTVTPRLIIDFHLDGWRAAINAAYTWRDEYDLRWLDVKPEFTIGAAVGIPLIEHNLELLGELETTAKLSDFFTDSNTDYLEGRLAFRYVTDYGLGVTVGAGAGFLSGYGSPLYRVFAGLNYTPRHVVRDLDGDGLEDYEDRCPAEAEDRDGFEDEDGCPDLDNDRDGIEDVRDRCPDEPEDPDGFEDEDGCPDPDNDGDGVLDASDACPNDPEDADGYQDEDGCPDPDNDGDGILDDVDRCPDRAENFNGCEDTDGCPESARVCVTEEKIVIFDKIYFKTNRAKIKPESFPILDELARVLIANPRIRRVRVEGHTDDRGRDRYNLKLSKKRARAVMDYLIRAGVAAERLESEGYGETQPIAPNDTEEGRARNRRVEFTILEQDPPGGASAPAPRPRSPSGFARLPVCLPHRGIIGGQTGAAFSFRPRDRSGPRGPFPRQSNPRPRGG